MSDTNQDSAKSLYEKLGGADTVKAAVDIFYGKIMADDRVNHFFEGTDMQRQRMHQRTFLAYAFGGLSHYSGTALRQAHRRPRAQGLSAEHFEAFMEHLEATLREMDIDPALIKEVMEIIGHARDEVLDL